MGTFSEQREVEQVETVRDICRFEIPVVTSHMMDEEYTEEVEGEEVTKTRSVEDGGPDVDVFVYVGGERSEHRRQVPRAKVIAGWDELKAVLLRIYNNAE